MIDFTEKKALFSLEVFPPKDSAGLSGIYASMGRFKELNPDYISVTYGAGGSALGNTVEIASDIYNKFGMECVAHFTCYNATHESASRALGILEQRGISHILALRGDKREGSELSDFRYATDLIEFINKRGGFHVAAACYPEGHIESPDLGFDIEIMQKKADLGITHFISQLFFDNEDFLRMRDAMAAKGIAVPMEAGIMPVTNPKNIVRMVSLSGAKLPPKLTKLFARFENDPAAFESAGLNYSVDQITDLLAEGADGIHLYVMNNPRVAEFIYRSISPILAGINRK